MKFETDDQPDPKDVDALLSKLIQYNLKHLDVKEKPPLAVWCKDDSGKITAGITGYVFGHWLEIHYFFVNSDLRGSGIGSKLLNQMEQSAKERGCRFSFLNTFSFQAKPFYEKNGYKEIFSIDNYPLTSTKHFLVKELV